ncbi:MAG: hypothetical protein GX900_04850 [Clostridiaceae bacterium]|nr:hypothetical protein [Clostridiaceae bacterium]
MFKPLSEIDKHLPMPPGGENDLYLSADQAPLEMTGQLPGPRDGYRRLDRARVALLAEQGVNEGAQGLLGNPAGVTVRFRTDSPTIALSVRLGNLVHFPHFALTGTRGIAVYVGSGPDRRFMGVSHPEPAPEVVHTARIEPVESDLPPAVMIDGRAMREWQLYLPIYNDLEALAVGVAQGSTIIPPAPYTYRKPILFYGSSITQGGCASHPGNTYTAMVTRWLDIPQINLGFSGSAKGEPAMADLIAAQDIACFVMDLDHNMESVDALRERHELFFKRVRKAQPDLPVIIMTKPDFEFGIELNKQRRRVIRKTYLNAVRAGDRRVWFVDGQTLFGRRGRDNCTVDRCHPNDLGFYRMARRIEPLLRSILNA